MIKLRDLSVILDGKNILNNINVNIKQGEYILLIGPNGGGKTTLLKTIIGLISPSCGTIQVDSKNIGYFPQLLSVKNGFPITVFEFIVSSTNQGTFFIKAALKLEILDWLNKVGLKGHQNTLISKLSGGQLQRVLLIRALISKPDLLILDEPTSALDSEAKDYLDSLLLTLQNKGVTIIHASHHSDNHLHKRVFYINKYLNEIGDTGV